MIDLNIEYGVIPFRKNEEVTGLLAATHNPELRKKGFIQPEGFGEELRLPDNHFRVVFVYPGSPNGGLIRDLFEVKKGVTKFILLTRNKIYSPDHGSGLVPLRTTKKKIEQYIAGRREELKKEARKTRATKNASQRKVKRAVKKKK